MEMTGITAVAAITVVCYLAAEGVKAAGLEGKWVPVLCGVCGGVLGLLGRKIMPAFPGEDVLTALAVGIVSGFAATGVHETGRQLRKEE